MKHHLRGAATATIRCTSMFLCAVLVCGWLLSGWYSLTWDARYNFRDRHLVGIELSRGGLSGYWIVDELAMSGWFGKPLMWNSGRATNVPQWRLWFVHRKLFPAGASLSGWQQFIPLWVPLLACGLPTAIFWRRGCVQRDQCVCGYSRAGLVQDAHCPECGQIARPSATKARSAFGD